MKSEKHIHLIYGLYQLLLYLFSPVLILYTLITAIRYRSIRYFKQRLGFFDSSSLSARQQPLWFHCASIGEVNTTIPLIQMWLKEHAYDSIILTTNTITAAKIIENNIPYNNIKHYYLPLDYPKMCQRFLSSTQPRYALIMETEIWLNLFTTCARAKIPLLILNARLSKKTLDHKWLRPYYQIALAQAEHIYARNEEDAYAYAKLSGIADNITVLGNLKYSMRFPNPFKRLINRPYFLAASTHDTEETGIATAFQQSNQRHNSLLVIVPRHPQRGKSIKKKIRQLGLAVQKKSDNEALHAETEVYIIDTIGELPALIQYADMVITGGSFIPHGGHNILEAALLKTPQVTGIHIFNFHEEIQLLEKAQGIIQLAHTEELTAIFNDYLTSPETYSRMAENAYDCIIQYEHIVNNYHNMLVETLHRGDVNPSVEKI